MGLFISMWRLSPLKTDLIELSGELLTAQKKIR